MTIDQPYGVIIAALDDSRAYGRVLGLARTMARAFGARLVLMRSAADVAPPLEPSVTPVDKATERTSTLGYVGPAELSGTTTAPYPGEGGNYRPRPSDSLANTVDPPPHIRNVEDTAATGDLNILSNQLRDEGFTVTETDAVEDLAQAVLGEAGLHQNALIILAARHQGTLERLFSSSASEKIIHEAPCPVLLVPGVAPR